MGRDQGPLVTRCRITGRTIRVLAAVLAVLLAGCGGNANVQASSNNGSASGSVGFPGRSSLGTLLSIIFLAGVSYESDRAVLPQSESAPDPDPARRVVEHDCSKPIEDWSANLRCR